jgi:Ca2+:H+ antiporter
MGRKLPLLVGIICIREAFWVYGNSYITIDPNTGLRLPYNTSHVAVVTTNPIRTPGQDHNQNKMPTDSLPENLAPNMTSTTAPVTWVHAKEPEEDEDEEAAGHDSPNWSKSKSFTILFGCTILYSLIAEILVDTVDTVMDSLAIDEKFLGLTLFALVSTRVFLLHGDFTLV